MAQRYLSGPIDLSALSAWQFTTWCWPCVAAADGMYNGVSCSNGATPACDTDLIWNSALDICVKVGSWLVACNVASLNVGRPLVYLAYGNL